MPVLDPPQVVRKIHTVGELTLLIRQRLEKTFPYVWVTGEISDLRVPVSGHAYFTLKDADALIRCVMFKGQAQKQKFVVENGMHLIALGRVSVYEARGEYQLVVEHLEPAGMGALALAFENLRKKLAKEGLFNEDRKKPLPYLPRRIAVITSPTGAAVRDILHVLDKRFPGRGVLVVPVRVQGAEAPSQIVEALELVNERGLGDVIILARGGGSLEDLAAFNDEGVARAVCASRIPVVSAVGHETDFTIADFCADMRAPTPSAAAQMVVPNREALAEAIGSLRSRLAQCLERSLARRRERFEEISRRLVGPVRRMETHAQRVDDLSGRLTLSMNRSLFYRKQRVKWLVERLEAVSPQAQVENLKASVEEDARRLFRGMQTVLARDAARVDHARDRLSALSPLAVLARGYSITRDPDTKAVLTRADQVPAHSRVQVLLHKGELLCRVESSQGESK
ncbi:MAG: exodeoxyribonuclease VII large subunit [Deltaproteobacteria bacterium]|nr:exodeoxyribonuclease VII large subunit [Deltaproteobacteria bacterium]